MQYSILYPPVQSIPDTRDLKSSQQTHNFPQSTTRAMDARWFVRDVAELRLWRCIGVVAWSSIATFVVVSRASRFTTRKKASRRVPLTVPFQNSQRLRDHAPRTDAHRFDEP
jgi:hypothetical protein